MCVRAVSEARTANEGEWMLGERGGKGGILREHKL